MSDRHTGVHRRHRRRVPLAILGVLIVLAALSWVSVPERTDPVAAAEQTEPAPVHSDAQPQPGASQLSTPAPPELPSPGVSSPSATEPEAEPTKAAKKPQPGETVVPLNPAEVRKEASSAVRTYLKLFDSALQGKRVADKKLVSVSTGSATSELQGAASDYQEQGFLQVGDAKVLDVTFHTMKLDAKRPTVVAAVCVDATKVDVQDGSGMSLRAFLFRPGEPVLQTFEVTLHKSAWRVSARQISDEVTPCSR